MFELARDFGPELRQAVWRELRHHGVRKLEPAEVEGLAVDVCVDLFSRARSWDPSRGVPPWDWARRRVANLVSRYVGQWSDELDPERHDVPESDLGWGGPEPEVLDLLEDLARLDPRHRLVLEALERVTANRRNREVLLAVRLQASLGDPSPANTVASQYGLKPDNVRQICKRTRDRLRQLAACEPRFAVLAATELVA